MGAALTIVGRDASILLPEGADETLLDGLRSATTSSDVLPSIVSALAAAGVLELPPFAAVVHHASELRVLVRGSATATVQDGVDGSETSISGAGASTWREESFPATCSVLLAATAADAEVLPQSTGSTRTASAGEGPPRSRSKRRAQPLSATPPPTDTGDPERVAEEEPRPERVSELTLAPPEEAAPDQPQDEQNPLVEPVGANDDQADFDFSHLLEETHFRGVEAAAVRSESDGEDGDGTAAGMDEASDLGPTEEAADQRAEPGPVAPPTAETALISGIPGSSPEPLPEDPPKVDAPAGDHDGFTIAQADRKALLGDLNAGASKATGRDVQAVVCVGGHPNPPHAPTCRSCGGEIVDRAVREIPRPNLGRIRLSTGAVVELDRPQLIGRRPSVSGADPSVAELPGLVTVPDPEQALSRVHAEVQLEGWDVYVVDRGSKNGTFVEIPGHQPTKLRADEPCLVVPGTRISLADVVELHYEVGQR